MSSNLIVLSSYRKKLAKQRDAQALEEINEMLEQCRTRCLSLGSANKRADLSQGVLFVQQMIQLAIEADADQLDCETAGSTDKSVEKTDIQQCL